MKDFCLNNEELGRLAKTYHGYPYHFDYTHQTNPYVDSNHVEPSMGDFKANLLLKNKSDYDFSGKSCAIVGSSPSILKKEYGKEIDKYDFIVRCNEAETIGYEKHTGSKTNFRIIGRKCFTNLNLEREGFVSRWNWFPKQSNQHFLIRPAFGPENMRYKSIMDCLQQYHNRTDINISLISGEFEKAVMNYLSGKEASSGFLAISFFTNLFDTVDIYGFDHHKRSTDGTMQYYFNDTKAKLENSCHKYDLEKNLVSELEKSGEIRIHE